jgi:hypothetical protein
MNFKFSAFRTALLVAILALAFPVMANASSILHDQMSKTMQNILDEPDKDKRHDMWEQYLSDMQSYMKDSEAIKQTNCCDTPMTDRDSMTHKDDKS